MNILDLPPNVMITVFSCLDQRDVINLVRKTCKLWYQLSYERKLWKQIHMQKFNRFKFCARTFNAMLSMVSDSVEVLYMDLKQLDKTGVLHENVICSNLKKLCLYWDNEQSVKSGEKVYTIHCRDGVLLRAYLPVLSSKYTHLKSLHLFSHVVFVKDLLDLFVELEEIEIEYCDFTFDDAEVTVGTFFNNHKAVKHLSIRFSVFDHKTLSYILSNVPGLKALDLSNSNFNCDEIDMNGIHQENLERLVLTNTRSNDRLLGHLVKNASWLRHVSIGDCVDLTNNGVEFLADNCPNLETLIINEVEYSKCNITDSGLQKVAEQCRNITVLKMVHCDEIGDLGVQAISRACSHLTVLEAARCTAVTDTAVMSIIRNCRHIEKLDLGHCVQLTSASINKLLMTCALLRYLNLETCHRISDLNLECSSFIEGEASNENETGNVNGKGLSTNDIEFSLDVDVELKHSANVKQNDEFDEEGKDLYTDTCRTENKTEKEISNTVHPVDSSAPWHSHIQTLNLGFCSKIGNKCLKQIAKYCPDLQSLNVQGCAMVTNAGVLAIVQNCLYLKKLNISGGSVFQTSRLTDDCLNNISKYCMHLTKLTIVKNHHITTEGVFKVIKGCPNIEELRFAASRSHTESGIMAESLTKAAGEVFGKTLCIKILGSNAKITVATDSEYKLSLLK